MSQLDRIPTKLLTKTFALKWPRTSDPTLKPIPVNLYVESKGFYLICINKITKEVECFDLALIHDTRTGTLVTLPPGAKNCKELQFRTSDESLESKWLTIAYGNSFVPIRDFRLVHFCFESQSVARQWADPLFLLGHSCSLKHLSSLQQIEKLHSRIIEGVVQQTNDEPKIVVKDFIENLSKRTLTNSSSEMREVFVCDSFLWCCYHEQIHVSICLLEFLCKNNVETNRETKILHALKNAHLPSERDSRIHRHDFTFEKFFSFYLNLTGRNDVKILFDQLGASHDGLRSDKFKQFLQNQDDEQTSCGWEVYQQKTIDLIRKFNQKENPKMLYESFVQYLLSTDNYILDRRKFELFMDMDQPLPHYFIASSHNTYLTGLQYRGNASVEMYRQVLLTGCRCIELDVMDSDRTSAEPEIKHKNTPVRPIMFIDTIVAIRDYAFKVTDYPLILSLENHCSAAGQTRMAQYLIEVFGESLLVEPLSSHPCEENQPLPSPNLLKNKILIKNKKCDPKSCSKFSPNSSQLRTSNAISAQSSGEVSVVSRDLLQSIGAQCSSSTTSSDENYQIEMNPSRLTSSFHSYLPPPPPFHPTRTATEEIDDFSDDEPPCNIPYASTFSTEPVPEAQAIPAMSGLVVYTVPTPYISFQHFASRNRSYEMISLVEDRAKYLQRQHPKEFLAYNQRQFSRIYPRGTRLDSTNFSPHPFWSVGCQLVALNYQTLDIPMQLNLAMFSFNGACGYLKKPTAFCQTRTSYDPSTRTPISDVVPSNIRMKILSGQFFCQDRTPTYVDVRLFGIDADSPRRSERRIRLKEWNGFQAIYEDNNRFNVEFSPVIFPEMASIRIAVVQDDSTMIGQVVLPVNYLRSGYRHIVLRNPMNISSTFASLFVFIERTVYISADHLQLADILVRPCLNKQNTTTSSSSSAKSSEIDSSLAHQLIRHHSSISTNSTTSSQEQSAGISTTDDYSSPLAPQFSSSSVRFHPGSVTSPELDQNASFSSTSSSMSSLSATSTFSEQSDWYKKHLLAASAFQRPDQTCKLILFNEIEQEKDVQRLRKEMENKVKSFADEQEKILKTKEQKLRSGANRSRSLSRPSFSTSSEFFLTETSSSNGQTTKKIDDVDKELFILHKKSIDRQEEIESALLMNFYDQLRKMVQIEYDFQEKNLKRILDNEIKRVKTTAAEQRKKEENQLKTEKDKKKLIEMKETIVTKTNEIVQSMIETIEEMYKEVVKQLGIYQETTEKEIRERSELDYVRCFGKYVMKLDEVQLRFKLSTDEKDENNDDLPPPVPPRVRMTASASLSAALQTHSNDFSSSISTRTRQ